MRTSPTLHRPPTTSDPEPPTISRLPMLALAVVLAIITFVVATGVALTIWDSGPATPDVSIDEPVTVVPPADDPAPQPGSSTDVRHDEEPRANWDVTGVVAGDELQVRDAPGADQASVATLGHDAAEFESTGRIAYVGDELWREIVVPNDGVGWVDATYLTETAPSADIVYSDEPRANWDVTGVASDDVLNVRELPGARSTIVATLAHDAAGFESTGRIAQLGDQLWREIVVPGDGVGWVSAAYLTETSPPS